MINDAHSLRSLEIVLAEVRGLAEQHVIKVTPFLAKLAAAIQEELVAHKMRDHPYEPTCSLCRNH